MWVRFLQARPELCTCGLSGEGGDCKPPVCRFESCHVLQIVVDMQLYMMYNYVLVSWESFLKVHSKSSVETAACGILRELALRLIGDVSVGIVIIWHMGLLTTFARFVYRFRTLAFHVSKTGSIPVPSTINFADVSHGLDHAWVTMYIIAVILDYPAWA
jgi:hypothetical protein